MTSPFISEQPWRGFEILVVSPTPTHPQDHGNRKRFFELCRELKQQGAKIHFVHYASEHDWRYSRPAHHEKEMAAAWDSYQLVAPSRPVHQDSIGEDHLIDEWADPALVGYVRWACAVHRYDVVIVAYTWMSFCFEAVPEGVFKICDTNDVFSGRRALLAANGIDPEFFHTTPEEEAKGLRRADLVWAIKEAEQRFFERDLDLKQCLTLLYAEPDRHWWQEPPSKDGWLRIGVIGARNNVNRRNLEAFLAEALPLFVSYMAPVKIVIAGGCSDDFRDYRHPNLEVIGRVPDVADFYRGMDVICAPMQFSTGLKIKVAEALASGAPLIAHAHAMEGYPIDDPLHALPNFYSMAFEMVKLAFDRSGLKPLAECSRVTSQRIQAMVRETLDVTRRRIVDSGGRTVCVVAPLEAFDPRGLLYDHLYATLNYVRFAARIVLYLVGSPARIDPDVFRHHGFDLRVFIDPDLAEASRGALPAMWTPLGFETVLRTRGYERVYFLSDVPGLEAIDHNAPRSVFLRYDAIELSGGDPLRMIEYLTQVTSVVVLSAAVAGFAPEAAVRGVSAFRQIPFRRGNAFSSFAHRRGRSGYWSGLLVLGDPTDPLSDGLRELATRHEVPVAFLNMREPGVSRAFAAPSDGASHHTNITGARLIVDLQGTGTGVIGVILEGARRAGVPVVRFIRGAPAATLMLNPHIARPATIVTLFRTVSQGLADPNFRQLLIEEAKKEAASLAQNDVGWTWLWRDLTRGPALARSDGSSVEALFE